MKRILQRRLGRSSGAHKPEPIMWMGCVVLRMTSLQGKHDLKGWKHPSSPSTRRKRGSRGTRKGRARGRQPRCSPKRGSISRKPHEGESWQRYKPVCRSYKEKAQRRRVDFVTSRFEAISVVKKKGTTFKMECGTPPLWLDKKLWVLRCAQFGKHLATKNFPCPPFDVREWYLKWEEMKFGTWSDVSTDFGEGDWEAIRYFPPPSLTLKKERKKTRSQDHGNAFIPSRWKMSMRPKPENKCRLTHHHGDGSRCVFSKAGPSTSTRRRR
jgi:hypothetical protein